MHIIRQLCLSRHHCRTRIMCHLHVCFFFMLSIGVLGAGLDAPPPPPPGEFSGGWRKCIELTEEYCIPLSVQYNLSCKMVTHTFQIKFERNNMTTARTGEKYKPCYQKAAGYTSSRQKRVKQKLLPSF